MAVRQTRSLSRLPFRKVENTLDTKCGKLSENGLASLRSTRPTRYKTNRDLNSLARCAACFLARLSRVFALYSDRFFVLFAFHVT